MNAEARCATPDLRPHVSEFRGGPIVDALVASRVLGWAHYAGPADSRSGWRSAEGHAVPALPPFSTDVELARTTFARECRRRQWSCDVRRGRRPGDDGAWTASVKRGLEVLAAIDAGDEAVSMCVALVMAVGVAEEYRRAGVRRF